MKNLTIHKPKDYCPYYVANVDRHMSYYFVAIMKSFDNMVFDRTIDVETSLFEFFVAPAFEQQFLDLMAYFATQGLVTNLQKRENRLQDPLEFV